MEERAFREDPRVGRFLEARKADIRAGAAEPHRTLLAEMVQKGAPHESVWAMTRSVEAGNYEYFPTLTGRMVDHVRGLSQPRSGLGASVLQEHWFNLRGVYRFHQASPWWRSLEQTIAADPEKVVTGGLYALLCYNTRPSQRELMLSIASRIAPKVRLGASGLDPWADPRFWIVLDWVIAWGSQADFGAFEAAIPEGPARDAFQRHTQPLRELPDFFSCTLPPPDAEGEIGERLDGPGSRPGDAALQYSQVRIRHQPAAPRYPEEARARSLANRCVIRTVVDEAGNTCGYRPLPGPWLAFFAPSGVTQIRGWKFHPAKKNEVPIRSRFDLTVHFKLR